jgi:hypothetical protein
MKPKEMIINDATNVSECMQRVNEWAIETKNNTQWDSNTKKVFVFCTARLRYRGNEQNIDYVER